MVVFGLKHSCDAGIIARIRAKSKVSLLIAYYLPKALQQAMYEKAPNSNGFTMLPI